MQTEAEGPKITADPSKADLKPLWWDQWPTMPLLPTEQARFSQMAWIEPLGPSADTREQASLGIKSVVLGNPEGVMLITQAKDGTLLKRDIREPEEVIGLLSCGPDDEAHRVYTNDTRVAIGTNDRMGEIKVVFRKGVEIDGQTAAAATTVVVELLKTILQDRTSRQVRQAQKDLEQKLKSMGMVVPDMVSMFDKTIQEAAIQQGLVADSRASLPARIRQLADRMEEIGIKMIQDKFFDFDFTLWPSGIRSSWTHETDDLAWNEWARKE